MYFFLATFSSLPDIYFGKFQRKFTVHGKQFIDSVVTIIIIIFISMDPNTEYKGCGNVIHKRTTVQMYYSIQFNSIYLCAKLNSHRPITKLAQVVQRRRRRRRRRRRKRSRRRRRSKELGS
jgi:hypothetical protein